MRKKNLLFKVLITSTLLAFLLVNSVYGYAYSEPKNLNAYGEEIIQIPVEGTDVVVKTIMPPKSWNPLKATDEELSRYCYPQRPSDPKELEEWKDLVSGEHVRPQGTMKHIKIDSGDKESSNLTAGVSSDTSGGWSGYVSNKINSRVKGNWNQTWATSNYPPAAAVHFVGLGGYHANPVLVQAGSVSEKNPDGSGTYCAFIEIVGTSKDTHGASGIDTSSLPCDPNDQMYSDISFTTYSSGGITYGKFSYYIKNISRNTAYSAYVDGIQNYSGVTNSAEWITERPQTGSSFMNLAAFGTQSWLSCQSGSDASVSYPPLDTTTVELTMVDSSSSPLAEPGFLGSYGNFQITYVKAF